MLITSIEGNCVPPSSTLAVLDSHLRRLIQNRSSVQFKARADWAIFAGYETRYPADAYDWDGQRRNSDPTHPFAVWQYTLDGWGQFEQGGEKYRVGPGQAFLTIVPSAHRYLLPNGSSSWSFFYIALHHPYVVQRLTEQLKTCVPVISAPPETRLLARSLSLIEECASTTPHDTFAQEQLLFDWMFELERFIHTLTYPQAERERWLEDVRLFVLERLSRTVDISELAAARDLSRSHFSHRFKAATGLAPAQWVLQIRLEEATRRLLYTDQKLETIARETGMGNANQLCKVFRRRFHMSPGEFRRQMR
jgi:AraC-like DNA-binding protein